MTRTSSKKPIAPIRWISGALTAGLIGTAALLPTTPALAQTQTSWAERSEVVEKLGWSTGSYLQVSVDGDAVKLARVEVDPFAEALKKPDADAFEKILGKQKKSQEEAFKSFEEKLKDPPEVQPEDRPDYWR